MSYQLLSYGNVSVLFTLSCLFPTFNLFLWNKKGFCWEKNRFEKYFLNGRSAHLSPSHTGLWRRSQPCTVCCSWWLFELICPLGIWFPCCPTLPSSHDRIECAQGLRNQVARKLRHPRVIHQNYLPIQTAIKQTLYSGQISRNFITKLSCLVMENGSRNRLRLRPWRNRYCWVASAATKGADRIYSAIPQTALRS